MLRSPSPPAGPRGVGFGPFVLDAPNRRLTRAGQDVTIAPKTLDLLIALASRAGDLVTKDELMQLLWPETFVDEANLTQHVFVLRRLLGQAGDEQTYIATVPRAGYRFVAPLIPDATADHETTPPAAVAPAAVAVSRWGRGAWLGAGALVGVIAVIVWAVRPWPNPIGGREMVRLTSSHDVGEVAISADGRFVAYVRTGDFGHSVWLHQRATGQALRIVDEAPGPISSVAFAPDGERLYFSRSWNGGEWWETSVLGGEPRLVLRGFDSQPSLSPDGATAAVIRVAGDSGATTLELVTLATGSATTLLRRARPSVIVIVGGITWSPDGARLAVVTNESFGGQRAAIVAVDAATGVEEVIADSLPWNAGRITWLPDDSGFILSARRLYFVDRRSGAVRPLTSDAAYYPSVAVSQSGTVVARRQEEESAVWRLPEGAVPEQAVRWFSEAGFNHAIAWLPDGRLAYESWASGDPEIWVTPREVVESPQQLTATIGYDAFPAVAPDGSRVVYVSGRDGGSTLWTAPFGRADVARLGPAGAHYAPDFSPDGRSLVYHSGDPDLGWRLWRINSDGQHPISVSDRPATFGVYSPDGRLIACNWFPPGHSAQPWSIALLPADGGPPVKILPVPGRATRRLVWSRDGQSLFWTDPGEAIRRVEISSGQSSLVARFPGERVLALASSRLTGELAWVRYTSGIDLVIWP